MTRRRRPVDEPRHSRLAPIVAGLLLAALAFTVSGVFPFHQLFQQQREVDERRERLHQLATENESLTAEIQALQTDDEIERIAREQYGLVRPGESAYVVVVPGHTVAETTTPAVEPDESRSWWFRMWDFVTGGDVGSDG